MIIRALEIGEITKKGDLTIESNCLEELTHPYIGDKVRIAKTIFRLQKNDYSFFENKECKFYPCHKRMKKINCLFCFCPLYNELDCGGKYTILLSTGKPDRKDCSKCTKPHKRKEYVLIMKHLEKIGCSIPEKKE